MELAAESHDAVGIARGHGPAVPGDDIAELLEFPGRDDILICWEHDPRGTIRARAAIRLGFRRHVVWFASGVSLDTELATRFWFGADDFMVIFTPKNELLTDRNPGKPLYFRPPTWNVAIQPGQSTGIDNVSRVYFGGSWGEAGRVMRTASANTANSTAKGVVGMSVHADDRAASGLDVPETDLAVLTEDCPTLKFRGRFADIEALSAGDSTRLLPIVDETTPIRTAEMASPGREVALVLGSNGFVGAHLAARSTREPGIAEYSTRLPDRRRCAPVVSRVARSCAGPTVVRRTAIRRQLAMTDVDHCVIGAGFAGSTAALRLKHAGRSVAVLSAAVGRIDAETRVRHHSLHDPLTELPNRTAAYRRITAALHTAHRERTPLRGAAGRRRRLQSRQ